MPLGRGTHRRYVSMRRRTMRSGFRGRKCRKSQTFVPFVLLSFSQFWPTHTTSPDSCILFLRYASIYIGVTGTPALFPFSSNFIHPSLYRCGSTERPLLVSLGASDPPKYRPSLTSIEPIRIRHGPLEGKDVSHMPYSNETWTAEFKGSWKRMRGRVEIVCSLRWFCTHIGTRDGMTML